MSSVLVQDPHHPYAVHLIELMHRRYGHRAVVFFTNRRNRLRGERRYPKPNPEAVEATYDVHPGGIAEFADLVRSRHDVVGVLPYNEEAVLFAAQLADSLGLGWNSLDTMHRFRDKHALKRHVVAQRPGLRMNASRRVANVDDVLPGGVARFPRYVLKPNDGFGNRDIAFFNDKTPRAVVDAFMRRSQGSLLLEEFVEGEEYFVNGQVDAEGHVAIVAAFRYTRIAANGRANIDHETRVVRHDDPTFALLESYTCEVVRASGLRRSPFHVEIKIDDRGPCLIEMGARLPGNGNAWVCNALHGGRLDVFALAAHGYVSDTAYGPLGLDWDHYNRTDALYVHGIATRRELVHEVEGLPDVERLSSFAGWVKKPVVGEPIEPTVSSLTMPWCVVLMSGREGFVGMEPKLADSAAEVRRLIQINRRPAPTRRMTALARWAAARAEERLRWYVDAATTSPKNGAMLAMNQSTLDTAKNFARKGADAVVRRLKLRGLLRHYGEKDLPDVLSPSRIAQANALLRWLDEYISEPHKELGRKGPVCPFVNKTVQINRLYMSFHDEIDGADVRRVESVLIAHADRLKVKYPESRPDGGFASVLVVFPAIPDAKMGVLDEALLRLKSHFMAADVMTAAFHQHSTKPAIHNTNFKVYQAPLPCIVLRHMDIRDIIFLGTNRKGFQRYRARFADRFAQGLISNEFGYVDRFNEAVARFPSK